MHETMFIFIILIALILFFVIILWYRKPKEGFEDTSSEDLPLDASNPTLTSQQYYGEISQAARISIFKSHEISMATANPDSIPMSEGDPKTGSGAGPFLTLTTIPDQAPPPDDVEYLLNNPVKEGFEDVDTAKQIAGAVAQQQVDALKAQLSPEALKQRAIDEAKGRAQAKAQEQLEKRGKKAGKMALKGATKAAQKLKGKLLSKVGSKLGAKATSGILKKIMTKIATKIITKAGIAMAAGVTLSTNPFTLGFGIFLNVVAAVGMALGIALPLTYEDDGMCDPGWTRVSDNWPSYLDSIPGVGDVMGALAPYMCSIDRCEPDEQEDGGLCYPKCDGGYTGVGPICWTDNVNIGVGLLKDCPSGYENDGLICREPIHCDPISCKSASDCFLHGQCGCSGGDCHGGTLIGRMNNDWRLKCPTDHPNEIDGLCYADCPMRGGEPTTVTKIYPVYVKKTPSVNQDIAQKALSDAIADKSTDPDKIKSLQDDLGKALVKDSMVMMDPKAPYIRNPAGPRIGAEPVDAEGAPVIPRAPRRWPAIETPSYKDLLAAIENGKVVFYSVSLGGWQTFESIYGSYGRQLDKDGRKAIKVSMSEVGPQIVTDVDGRYYRWNTEKGDWEWNNWGGFKDLAAANDGFTYFQGTNNEPYWWRWPAKQGDKVGNGWSGQVGVAANNYGTPDQKHDTGNFAMTNTPGYSVFAFDWGRRYLDGPPSIMPSADKATDCAMGQNNESKLYVSTDKGNIICSWRSSSNRDTLQKPILIPGPLLNTSITAITVDPEDIIYVISGGRLFKQAPSIGPEPQINIPEIKWDPCATKIPFPFGNPICIGGIKITGVMIPNPNYQKDHDAWLAKKAAESGAFPAPTAASAAAAAAAPPSTGSAGAVATPPTSDVMWIEIVGKNVPDIAIGPAVVNDQYTAYNKYKSYMDILARDVYPKYPVPSFDVEQKNVATLSQTITTDPRKRLRRVPLMPFQCMGDRGLAYGRGVGVPKLKTRMVSKNPPVPPPPMAWLSSAHADDPATPCFADFSDPTLLQDMCLFYYNSNVNGAVPEKDGTIVYSYPTRITSVIASSEQSADVLCDITTTIVNPDTGQLLSTSVLQNSDRRFYFAIIRKTCKFVVTACTNVNGTGPYIKDPLAKAVSFIPVLTKCVSKPLTLEMCSDLRMINKMTKFYTDDPLGNIRIKSVLALEAPGDGTCMMVWTSAVFDQETQIEGPPDTNAAKFVFKQNTTTDICVYNIVSFTSISSSTVKELDVPIVITPDIVSVKTAEVEDATGEDATGEKIVSAEDDTGEDNGGLSSFFSMSWLS